MAAKKRSERRSPGGTVPPNGNRRPDMRGRTAGGQSSRALARAGTRGSGGDGRGSLMLWSAVFVVIAGLVVGITLFVSQSGNGSSGAVVCSQRGHAGQHRVSGSDAGRLERARDGRPIRRFPVLRVLRFRDRWHGGEPGGELRGDRQGQAGLARLPLDRHDPGQLGIARRRQRRLVRGRPGQVLGYARLALCQRRVRRPRRLRPLLRPGCRPSGRRPDSTCRPSRPA